MHYYKRNLGDYAKKAGRLSMLQHGSYTLLIDACYDREQFPTLEEAIEWTWASTTEEIEAVTFVLRKFFMLDNGVYVQKRIQEEIAEYHSKAETNKRIAIERETVRAEKRTERERVVNNPSESGDEPPPNHKPLTINQEPLGEGITPPTAAKRATRKCPVDFLVTEDMRTWATLECPGVDVDKATAKFSDHTFKTAMTDWPATWRNWLRSDQERIAKSATLPAWREQQRSETQKAVPRIALGVVNPNTFFTELGASNVTALKLG